MKKNFFLFGFILVLLVAIPVTVYFLKTTTQNNSSKAAAATTLSFNAASSTATVGQSFPVDIVADPGTNAISVVKLIITYDSSKLSTASGGLSPNTQAFPTTLDPITYGPCQGTFCNISVTLAIGADPTKAITTKTTVATLNLKPIAATDTPTNLTFGSNTTVYSVAQADQASENVLSSAQPMALTITNTGSNGTPGPSGAITPTIGATDTPTPTSDTGTVTDTPMPSGSSNLPPVCTSLSVDTATATPGGTINFTTNGNSPGATISKVTFNFGDSNVQDVTDGGGIGTNNVSVQLAHTYQTAGTYTATAVLTDSNNALSNPTSCTQVVTIGSGSATTTGETDTPTQALIPTKLPATGPGPALLGIGIVGAVLTVVGGLLFFGL